MIFVVSLAPTNLRQDFAFEELVKHAGGEHVLACFFRDEIQHHEAKLRLVHEYVLTRSSKSELGGLRQLPFLRDMLEAGAQAVRDSGEWIVVLNSDIIIRPELILQLHHFGGDAVTMRRTDVARPGQLWGKLLRNGIDGIAIRKVLWERAGDTILDFVLGEPGWGMGMRIWCKDHNWIEFEGGETLHVKHKGAWVSTDLVDPAKRHNHRLFRLEQCKRRGIRV